MMVIITVILFLAVILYDTYYFAIFLYQSTKSCDVTYNPHISVIIPVYNNQSTIKDCIDSVLRSHYDIQEVIVVNDGSIDETSHILDSLHDPRLLIYHISHSGKAAALNYGIERASGDIVTVDADTILTPHTIGNLVRNLKIYDAVAGNVQVSNRTGFLGRCQCIEHIRVAMFRKVSQFFNEIDIVPGPVGAFKKEIFSSLTYGASMVEDMELTRLLKEKGYRIGYEQEAKAYTKMPHTLTHFLTQRLRWARGNLELAGQGTLPLTAVVIGYLLALGDVSILALSIWTHMPEIVLIFFGYESCTMLIGTYREKEPCTIESLFFPVFMLFLDIVFLITYFQAFIQLQTGKIFSDR
ncbi:MAG: glycosyltransferase family 2 protein [Theionarchaea archaeon]|nr:glycosyltransferase family 2 protein [Theionarchaea archaeon]